MTLRLSSTTKSRLIVNAFRENAQASIRHIACQTGLSKSSVPRLRKAIERRNGPPESGFWETEEGRRWLIRLVVTVLYLFGLKRGVGAETMSECCVALHLEEQVGCAPRRLRMVMEQLEPLIVETTAGWEREGLSEGQIGPMVGAVDDTFLPRMMLVFMDLVSGYVLHEEVADDRTYETWSSRVNARLEPLKTRVFSLVSDRAKAFSKLAKTGLECPSIPEVFHLLQDLAKGYALAISRQGHTARQTRHHAQEHLDTCEAEGASETALKSAQTAVVESTAAVARWQQVRDASRRHLGAMSMQVPPWRVADATPQNAPEVEAQCAAEVAALQALLEANGLPVNKQVLATVRKPCADLAAVIDVWWPEVRQDVQRQMVLTPRWTTGVEAHVLPLVSWEQHVSRTRCPRRQATLVEVLEVVRAACEAHALTGQLPPEVLGGWKAWATEHAKTFQRASSAGEGRKGYLSQMHHNHRGLPQRRYKIWSALYHFDCRAADGSTPASRLFRREFPDLLETL